MKNQLIQVREKAQITLPSKVREVLGIREGDYLEAKVQKNGLLLSPKIMFDKIPEVTLSKEGENMLKESLEDVRKGRVKRFDNVEELIKDLNTPGD